MLHSVWHFCEPGILLAILIVALTNAATERTRQRWFGRLARRRWLSVVLVSCLALAGAILLTLGRGAPAPAIHDEFAYLLQGDTFAHGRLTNPTHPLADAFETFHVLQQPTYAGKYPPGQGLFLAAGQRLGHPIVGVWISFALFCGALCWMLQAWLPPRWALLGALLFLVRLLAAYGNQQWAYGYWSGAVAALGGALLFGAGRRLWQRPTWSQASVLGASLAILANSRPLEGLVASLFVAAALAWRYLVMRPLTDPVAWLKLVGGVALVLAPALIWMGYYNQQVTGDWRTLPYRVHLERYTQAPIFLWQSETIADKTYATALQQQFHATYEKADWNRSRTASGLAAIVGSRLLRSVQYFLGWILLVPFLIGVSSLRPWSLFATITLGGLCVVGLQTSWFSSHYLAPVTCLFAFQIAAGLRRLTHWRVGERYVGQTLAQLILLAYSLLALACLLPIGHRQTGWQYDRARWQQQLQEAGGRHLVMVHYTPSHSFHDEWVYNAAQIDDAPVVWAHEGGLDDSLFRYYHDRTVWRLHADEMPARLEQLRDPMPELSRAEP